MAVATWESTSFIPILAKIDVVPANTAEAKAYKTQALALEKPIVSTNISGSREMLGGGKYGMLCESSYDGLVNSLREILKSDVVFEEYKNKSILGKESLDHKIVIKKIESLLKS